MAATETTGAWARATEVGKVKGRKKTVTKVATVMLESAPYELADGQLATVNLSPTPTGRVVLKSADARSSKNAGAAARRAK